jgi:hypothetical protein
VENKIFQEFLRLYLRENSILSKYGGFYLRQAVFKAEEAFENCPKT